MKNNASKLHKKIFEYCKKRFPNYTIIQEYTIGTNDRGLNGHLFVDIFIKDLNLAIECHGKQHYEFNSFHYKNAYSFKKAKERDTLKEETLKKMKIKLVIFKYDDILEYEYFKSVIDKILMEDYDE